jgi:hypothetical protein
VNIQPVNNQPVSDDNDLAKVLSGADGDAPAAPIEESIVETPPVVEAAPVVPEMPPLEETTPPVTTATPTAGHEELEGIKKEALEELKPLVDKLQLPPEEKFDILLLIIRSCDDEELVNKAHHTATEIVDETRKAQALLDIIKEVDYFSSK